MRPLFLALLLPLAGAGCAARGFFTDGTSVSMGRADRGVLRGGRALPVAGEGFVAPPQWSERGHRFGTDELVEAIQRAAALVARRQPGAVLGVGDLSQRGGGNVAFHRSHENGRDADLLFYSVDANGAPLPPANAMPRYNGRKLRAREPYDDHRQPIGKRWFDVARNWSLVETLLADPTIDVQYLFVSERIRDRLIEHAIAQQVPSEVLNRARRVLRQPAGVPAHDDHLHVRIRCAAADRAQGCVDEGPVRLRSEIYRPKTTAAPRHRG